jgi:predicted nucleotidyltransferase
MEAALNPLGAPTVQPELADDLVTTMSEIVEVLERADIDYALIGGLAVSIHGRPRYSRDIDLFVRHEDAQRALDEAARAGFEVDPINPHWLFKAFKRGVQVDLLFMTQGHIYLDDEMVRRAARHGFKGCNVRVIAPEDLLVIKALAHDEETPRHWWDALAILTQRELDWDYVVRRATKGPSRVLSLLHYATSLGLLVPPGAVHRLNARLVSIEWRIADDT